MTDTPTTDAPPPLRVGIADGIATLTLDRPALGNAIDLPMARALLDAATRCADDPGVRCVVVTGAGRLFCAGGDVGVMRAAGERLPEVLDALIEPLHAAVLRLARMPKPLLVLVNGPAAGAGMSLALLGDVVLSARSAHYTAAYGAIGLTADGGLSWLLPRLAGLRRAQEMMLTNRRVGAEEAAAIGLVTRTVDDDALAAEGQAMAGRLAAAPAAALGAARALIADGFAAALETQLDAERRSMVAAARGAEAREGLSALFARRPPDFRGA